MKSNTIRWAALMLVVASTHGFSIAKNIKSRNIEKNEYLDLCERAINCEVYVDGDISRIRFIEGTEPGTTSYEEHVGIIGINGTLSHNTTTSKAEKRDNGAYATYISAARNTINYGNQNPGDIVHSPLWDNCNESACRTADTWKYSDFVQPAGVGYSGTMPSSKGLLVRATGKYPGWDYRNKLVQSVKEIIYKGQVWKKKDWSYSQYVGGGGGSWITTKGSAWEGTQSDYISVSIYWEYWSGNTLVQSMVGFVDVYVMYAPDKVDEGCGRVYDLLGSASGLIDGIGGALFGLLKLTCG